MEKTLEEFGLKKYVNIYDVLSLAMERLNVKWYFGLYRFSVDLDSTWKDQAGWSNSLFTRRVS